MQSLEHDPGGVGADLQHALGSGPGIEDGAIGGVRPVSRSDECQGDVGPGERESTMVLAGTHVVRPTGVYRGLQGRPAGDRIATGTGHVTDMAGAIEQTDL